MTLTRDNLEEKSQTWTAWFQWKKIPAGPPKLTRKRPISNPSLSADEPNKKKSKSKPYASKEKYEIIRLKKGLVKRIDEINDREYDYFDFKVNYEISLKAKNGEIVECVRSNSDSDPENEDSLH